MAGWVRPILDVQLLGEFHLLYDGKPLTAFFQGRLQALLAYLLLHRHVPQSRQQIAFLFWPNTVERQARNNLRQLLHYLRRALPSAEQFVLADAKTVQWRRDAPYRLDVANFEQALAKAAAVAGEGQVHEEQSALELAMQHYGGELLPSCYDDWILAERQRLSQAVALALQRLVTLAEEQQNYDMSVSYGERLLNHDPLIEQTYIRLIRLHALRGDRAAAARIFHRCVQTLKRELGVAPGAGTFAAYRHALSVDQPLPIAVPEQSVVATRQALVNRQEAWAELQTIWQRTALGQASLALISGEAGVGKTRLAEELLQTAAAAGTTIARMQARDTEVQLAYAPLIRLLRSEPCRSHLLTLDSVWRDELAWLLPELSTPRTRRARKETVAGDWRRHRLFEALCRATPAGDEPFLLLFDDVHWCDRDTIEWLHFLLQYYADSVLLVLGAVRPEEVDENHPLTGLLLDLRAFARATSVRLGPLETVDTKVLAEQVAGLALDESMALALYRYTEGNPLIVVETIRAVLKARPVSSEPLIADDLLPFRSSPPKNVEVIIEGRLSRLSTEAQEIVGLAATIGRVFTTEVLVEASERGEETVVQALEELSRRMIVRELDSATYRFSHGCLCQLAYKRISAARRRLFHRRAAGALERVYAGRLSAVADQITHHYRRAGKPGTSDKHSAKPS